RSSSLDLLCDWTVRHHQTFPVMYTARYAVLNVLIACGTSASVLRRCRAVKAANSQRILVQKCSQERFMSFRMPLTSFFFDLCLTPRYLLKSALCDGEP